MAHLVHPRACGEHTLYLVDIATDAGSSPRLRGTCRTEYDEWVGLRFIPAPAGNMVSAFGPVVVSAVHPRACGEHRWRRPMTATQIGSSPRLRGTS